MERRDPSRVGELVRRRRIASALSQEALAERAGLSARAISDLERGVHRAPRLESLRLLAEALGLDAAGRAELLAAAHPQATVPELYEHVRPQASAALPVSPTRLIGREAEVAAVGGLLAQDDVRLVTLTGSGGVGKTRVALAAAAEAVGRYPDGVWFVDLSPVTDPALVLPTVAGVVGVRGEESRLTDRLADGLRGKRALLVLDNFEQLVAAAPTVSDVLARVPGLTVLATSRTPLHAYGEREYPLSPLPLPDPTHLPTPERLGQYEAVRLFVERAQAVKPDFGVTAANAPAVAEICSRLDGLPLAIELAAAHVKVLPPQALLKRLEKRLPLLAGGARTLPARQQTMRQAIAWSHDLLDAETQVQFRRMAVFAGGCTLEAAEAVVDQEGKRNVFGGIAALVDTSLLRQEESAEGEPRFRMLETVREFGLERLEASGDGKTTWDRHARFFRDLAERAGPSVWETANPAQVDLLEREHDNLRAALAWSLSMGDHDTLLRLVAALASFWYYRGYLNEGQRWLTQALETPADAGTPGARGWALLGSGLLAGVAGDGERAAEVLTESFSWWEQAGDAFGHAFAGSLLGGVYVGQGRFDEASPLFAANRDFFRAAGHEIMLAHAVFHLGVIAWAQGDDARARGLLRESAAGYDRAAATTDAIDPLRYLGLLACAAGELDEAAKWFREEWTRLRMRGSRAAIAVGLADVATLAAARAAWQPAARLFAQAEALLRAEAAAFSLPARDHYERGHARAREALGAAASEVAAAGRALTLEQALAEAEEVLALDRDRDAGVMPVP